MARSMEEVQRMPWWAGLLLRRAWIAAVAAVLLMLGTWGRQCHTLITRAATQLASADNGALLDFEDDVAVLRETDKKLDAIRQSVSGIMQDNRMSYVDWTLQATRHSAGTLRQQTSGIVPASAEL
jgi:hypothetical protein